MTDRELLEAAAKAAGLKVLTDPHGALRDCTGADQARNIFSLPGWNPLTDDGDALRLAVKLGVNVFTASGLVQKYGIDQVWATEAEMSADPYAATRRAIVRAASAMVQP